MQHFDEYVYLEDSWVLFVPDGVYGIRKMGADYFLLEVLL